jgi:hypothetical protein
MLSLALLSVLAATAASGQAEAPIPEEGQKLPAHAAGGWPTSTTGDTKKPGRTAEQQAQLDAVTGELTRLARASGPDSVVLQAKLMVRSMSAGAVGPTEVRVVGPSDVGGPDFLRMDVETGVYFDEKTTTPESRRDTIWKNVALPVLDEMVTFKIEPSALELVFFYNVQNFAMQTGATPDPTEPSTREAFRVQLGKPLLDDMIADVLVGDAVRDKAVFAPHPVPAAAGK